MSIANVFLRAGIAVFLIWLVMTLVRREEEKRKK